MAPKSPKLGTGGYMTVADQIRLYEEVMGEERAREQVRLARIHSGKCVCEPSKKRIENNVRVIHHETCPQWKPWMKDFV